MILAIFQNERVYEGNQNFLNAVYPMPSLSTVVVDQITQTGLNFLKIRTQQRRLCSAKIRSIQPRA